MVMKPENGKYLTLEDVRVFYDAKDDSVHVTSKDKDLPKGVGFHLTLNRGRVAEHVLRELLDEAGLIPESKSRAIPASLSLEDAKNSNDPNKVPLGMLANDKEAFWDLSNSPNNMLCGHAGSGKSVVMRSILSHCSRHSEKFEVVAIDMKSLEFGPNLLTNPVVKTVATTMSEAKQALEDVTETMSGRYQLMRRDNLTDVSQLAAPPRRIIVIIEESSFPAFSEAEDARHEANRYELTQMLATIARLGRAAGIHICFGTQAGNVASQILTDLDISIKTDTSLICMGRISTQASTLLTGNDDASKIDGSIKGRGFFKEPGKAGGEFQAYFSPRKESYLSSHKQNPKKSE